jgi:hypothetical protein
MFTHLISVDARNQRYNVFGPLPAGRVYCAPALLSVAVVDSSV